MKKFIVLLLASLALSGSAPATDVQEADKTTYVYICTGKSSVAYHSHPKCKGLRNCRASVVKITLEEAEEMGRRPCKICVD